MAMRATAKEPVLYPISIEGKWGYIDSEGKVEIKPQFLTANAFSEGLAVVAVAGTTEEDRHFERTFQGFINADGKFVIPPKPPRDALKIEGFSTYSYGDFHEGLARIHINDASGMDGFIDRTGKVVVPLKYHTSADFSEGVAFATIWRKWDNPGPVKAGYIDKRGQFVFENDDLQFDRRFSHDRAAVTVRAAEMFGASALVDKLGKFVIPPGIYSSLSSPVEGAIRAVKDRKVGLLNVNGEVVVPLGKYDNIYEPASGGIFIAKSGEKWALIDSKGNRLAEVVEPGEVGRFSGEMATLERGGRFGYIDATGAMPIAPKFDEAERFDGELALVALGKTRGYINRQGKFIWKSESWDEPLRNSVSKPLSTFLPPSTVEALPLSYNWQRVKNAIVFAADGDLSAFRAWYKKRCSGKLDKLELHDDNDLETLPDKVDLTIYRPAAGELEVYAMAGVGDKETVDGFVDFYHCSNMSKLRKQHSKKIIAILIEN